MNADQLVRLLRNHSIMIMEYDESKIVVLEPYTLDCVPFVREVTLPVDYDAVSRFLGY